MVTKNQGQYVSIVNKLKSLEGKLAYLDSIKGLILAIGIVLICFGVLTGITVFGWPGRTARFVIDLVLLIAIGASLYLTVIKPLIKRSGLLNIARKLEKHYGKFQSRLIGALELYDRAQHNRENYSVELIEKTIEEGVKKGGIFFPYIEPVSEDKLRVILLIDNGGYSMRPYANSLRF